MNNKQVPEEIITDAFQISEDLKNGNIHNNRQFVQLSHVKELVASLPAEPSTPETKDKPAISPGSAIKIKNLDWFNQCRDKNNMLMWWKADTGKYPEIGDKLTVSDVRDDGWIHTKETTMYWPPEMFEATGSAGGGGWPNEILHDALKYSELVDNHSSANMAAYHGWLAGYKAATLRQPTGTVLLSDIQERIKELNELDNDYCRVRWDNNADNLRKALAREESNKVTFARQELERLAELAKKPIQIMPEREGAIAFAEFLRDNYLADTDGMYLEYGPIEENKRSKYTTEQLYQTFLQSTGEGINE